MIRTLIKATISLSVLYGVPTLANDDVTTLTLPGIGTTPKKSTRTQMPPHISLVSCAHAVGRATFNSLPVQSKRYGTYTENINLNKEEDFYKAETHHLLGDAASPKIAVMTKDSIHLQDLKVAPWEDSESGETRIVTLYRIEGKKKFSQSSPSDRFGDTHVVDIADYPRETYGYRTVNPKHPTAHDLPMHARADILKANEITSPQKIESTKKEIAINLRKSMDSFIDAMVFKARERVGLEKRTKRHRAGFDGYPDLLDSLKPAFCTCKDLPEFAGFEQQSHEKLFGKGNNTPSFGSFLIIDGFDEKTEKRTVRPLERSDLNCNVS